MKRKDSRERGQVRDNRGKQLWERAEIWKDRRTLHNFHTGEPTTCVPAFPALKGLSPKGMGGFSTENGALSISLSFKFKKKL
jgi:hypothetical protein